MGLYNFAMSEVRVAVEWLFSNTTILSSLISRASWEFIGVKWGNSVLFVLFWRMLTPVFRPILFQISWAFSHLYMSTFSKYFKSDIYIISDQKIAHFMPNNIMGNHGEYFRKCTICVGICCEMIVKQSALWNINDCWTKIMAHTDLSCKMPVLQLVLGNILFFGFGCFMHLQEK